MKKHKMERGLALHELLVAVAIGGMTLLGVVAVTVNSVKSSVILENQQLARSLSLEVRQNLIRIPNPATPNISACMNFFAGIDLTNLGAAAITEAAPYIPPSPTAIQTLLGLGTPNDWGDTTIVRAALRGVGPGGLEILQQNDQFATYRGNLEFDLSRFGQTFRTEQILISFTVDASAPPVLLACGPLLYGQSFFAEACQALGEDFRFDPGTQQCLVPIYNCCPFPNGRNCEQGLLAAKAEQAPCDHIAVQDALCDLQERGRVPGKSNCVGP